MLSKRMTLRVAVYRPAELHRQTQMLQGINTRYSASGLPWTAIVSSVLALQSHK